MTTGEDQAQALVGDLFRVDDAILQSCHDLFEREKRELGVERLRAPEMVDNPNSAFGVVSRRRVPGTSTGDIRAQSSQNFDEYVWGIEPPKNRFEFIPRGRRSAESQLFLAWRPEFFPPT